MKLYTCLLLVFMGITTASAQNIVQGSVTTKETNQPLPATIYIPQLEKGTVATLDGTYEIMNVPTGNYTIVFSYLGYATVSKKIKVSKNTSATEDIQLAESAVEMEEVIISTPFHKLQGDNVMKVERVSVNELLSKGNTTLAEGITNIPGVESISTGTGIGKPVIRGLSSNRVLTYTQGVRLENQQFGDEHGLGINSAGIESVEVIKGPASLLYGSDALGGVLYLNPERFAASGEIKGDIQSTYFSNTLGSSSNGGVQVSGEKIKFLARGGYSTYSDYETGNGERVTNTRFNEKDFKTGVQFQNEKVKSTVRYNYNRSNIGIPETIGEQTTDKELQLPYQEIDNHILSWDNTFFFDNSSLDVKLGYQHNDRREFEDHHHHEEEHEGDHEEEEHENEDHEGEEHEGEEHEHSENEPALHMKLNTINYDVKYNLPQLGNFETIAGVQGLYQTNENFGEELLIPDATTFDIGVFATTHYHLEKIDLQAGLRYDRRTIESDAAGTPSEEGYFAALDRDFNSFNAAIGAKVDIANNLITRLNLASGFRAPNLAELTSNGSHNGANRYEIGNPNLTNEQNLQVDVSLEFANEHFEVFANGFYNTVNDYIFISPTDQMIDGDIVYSYEQSDAKLYGGEFGLHIHPHPLDWLHIESTFETVTGKLNSDEYLPLIPANTLRNTLRVEFNESRIFSKPTAFVRLQNTFDQNNSSTFETDTDGYNLVSLGASNVFKLKMVDLKLQLSVTNLLNEEYTSHLSRLKPDGIFNIGRSINGTVKISL
ncbi:TonB-dependent receptor [Marixanthomonas ophiurae]|uniref:TonB-dependent receptor n=1 Tax=Marixanthomonas ophiurae TaxID=387659 RepID=A0A3E1Q879_9FLAO|nr:TonB-dependent receptor [Marixanthomonas ophiurae]RFN58336.1 TonB-dependent receptor [Marixanthomonas ophiurae]